MQSNINLVPFIPIIVQNPVLPIDASPIFEMRRVLEMAQGPNDMIKRAEWFLRKELDSIINQHNLYVQKLYNDHKRQIMEIKKNIWCKNCQILARFICCINGAYCSTECGMNDWNKGHNSICSKYSTGNARHQLTTHQNATDQNATLQNATHQNATHQNATLQNATDQNATLQNATHQNATLQNATHQNATLQNATLQNATLQNATLQNATLQNATLQNATLQNATLQNATHQYAKQQDATHQDATHSVDNTNIYKLFTKSNQLVHLNSLK